MKRKIANGKEIDVRILGMPIGCEDEYYEFYFPEKAKKERLEKIDKLKALMEEFKTTGDTDSYEVAVEKLTLAEADYEDFIKTVYEFMKKSNRT